MSLNVQAAEAQFQSYLGYYNKFKQLHPGDTTTFTGFLSSRGFKLDKVAESLEGALEGRNNDGVQGNTISMDRRYADGNQWLFQTSNNNYVQMDRTTGRVNVLSENQVANLFGVDGDDAPNGSAYDVLEVGRNTLTFHEYSFSGLEDGRADEVRVDLSPSGNASWKYTELDLTTDKGRSTTQTAINNYLNSRGRIADFRDIFGDEQAPEEPVRYDVYNGVASMTVSQKGQNFTFNFGTLRP